MTTNDYKQNLLNRLKGLIHDLMDDTSFSVEEILDAIKTTSQDSLDYHKKLAKKHQELLDMVAPSYDLSTMISPNSYLKEDRISNFPETSFIRTVEVDAASGEFFINIPDEIVDFLKLKEGDTLDWEIQPDRSVRIFKASSQTDPTLDDLTQNGLL